MAWGFRMMASHPKIVQDQTIVQREIGLDAINACALEQEAEHFSAPAYAL